MSRRKTSTFEDLVEIAARLPWWGGLLVALVSYGVLHYFSLQTSVPPTDMKAMGSFVGRELWRTLASFLQYVVPIAFLIGALISAIQAVRAKRLVQQVRQAPSRNALESMSWLEFEELVGETFHQRGFQVERRGGCGPDGGVDLALRLGADLYLVQCKQWKARSVGVATVRELFGVMAAEGAVGGFVVASGDFTEDAKSFAEGRAIELVDTAMLLKLMDAGSGIGGASSPSAPACPKCGFTMVQKTAKRGVNAGQQFWGCARYPDCRGTRPA
ncbi:MAG TPA: restriction endonuclease [Rhodocyclaceae bacterium]